MLWTERPSIDLDLSVSATERFSVLPAHAVKHCQALLSAIATTIPPDVRGLADGVRVKTDNRFHDDACALAKCHGVDWRDVMLANVSYDLFLASLGCSTVVLPTPSGPVVARNMDWAPEALLARASYLVRCRQKGELAFAHAAWPASIGVVTGLSGKGFAIALNAVRSPEGVNLTGYPVLLFLRRVLEEASGFTEALRMISEQTLAMSALITLAGSNNDERVVIERSPTKHALRWADPGKPLMTTNHYRRLFLDAPLHSTAPDYECLRYGRLCRILDGYSADGEAEDSRLLTMLSDREVIQEITAQHVLIRPRTRSMQLYVPTRLLAA